MFIFVRAKNRLKAAFQGLAATLACFRLNPLGGASDDGERARHGIFTESVVECFERNAGCNLATTVEHTSPPESGRIQRDRYNCGRYVVVIHLIMLAFSCDERAAWQRLIAMDRDTKQKYIDEANALVYRHRQAYGRPALPSSEWVVDGDISGAIELAYRDAGRSVAEGRRRFLWSPPPPRVAGSGDGIDLTHEPDSDSDAVASRTTHLLRPRFADVVPIYADSTPASLAKMASKLLCCLLPSSEDAVAGVSTATFATNTTAATGKVGSGDHYITWIAELTLRASDVAMDDPYAKFVL